VSREINALSNVVAFNGVQFVTSFMKIGQTVSTILVSATESLDEREADGQADKLV
jgi:hypothetical protein